MRSIFFKVWVPCSTHYTTLVFNPSFVYLIQYVLSCPLVRASTHNVCPCSGGVKRLVVTRAGHATVFRTIFATMTMQKIPSLCTSSKALHKSDCPGNKVAAIMKKYNYKLIRMCILCQSLGMI